MFRFLQTLNPFYGWLLGWAELQIPSQPIHIQGCNRFKKANGCELDTIVMLNEVLTLSHAEVKHLCNSIKGDPSLRSG